MNKLILIRGVATPEMLNKVKERNPQNRKRKANVQTKN